MDSSRSEIISVCLVAAGELYSTLMSRGNKHRAYEAKVEHGSCKGTGLVGALPFRALGQCDSWQRCPGILGEPGFMETDTTPRACELRQPMAPSTSFSVQGKRRASPARHASRWKKETLFISELKANELNYSRMINVKQPLKMKLHFELLMNWSCRTRSNFNCAFKFVSLVPEQ